jgi:hypothetical protein
VALVRFYSHLTNRWSTPRCDRASSPGPRHATKPRVTRRAAFGPATPPIVGHDYPIFSPRLLGLGDLAYIDTAPSLGGIAKALRDRSRPNRLNLPFSDGLRIFSSAGRVRLSDDLLRFQSVLAISSSDKGPGFDRRDCSSLAYAGQLDMRDLAGSSGDLHTVFSCPQRCIG